MASDLRRFLQGLLSLFPGKLRLFFLRLFSALFRVGANKVHTAHFKSLFYDAKKALNSRLPGSDYISASSEHFGPGSWQDCQLGQLVRGPVHNGSPSVLVNGGSGTDIVLSEINPGREFTGSCSISGGMQWSTPRVPEKVAEPFAATDIDRHSRDVWINPTEKVQPILAARRVYHDPNDPGISTSWRPFSHPQGALYFFEKQRGIFTDNDIRNSEIMDEIEGCVDQLIRLAPSKGIIFPDPDVQLVIELVREPKEKIYQRFRYYFVDIKQRLLFWLDDYQYPVAIFQGLKGVTQPTHINGPGDAVLVSGTSTTIYTSLNRFGKTYRRHYELYPCGRMLDKATVCELRSLVVYAHAAVIMCEAYLVPFEPGQISKTMDIVNALEMTAREPITQEYNDPLMVVAAYFMHMFSRVKFFNFHGQPGARLEADRSIYETAEHRAQTSLLLRIMNYLLFFVPSSHSQELKRVWVDELVNRMRWRVFITEVSADWTRSKIYSIIMLLVDVSFLTIPGIFPPTQAFQPVSVIAIYVSTLCAVGSLLSSVVLTNQSRRSTRWTSSEVAEYMLDVTSFVSDTDYIAIMYSMPYGLLTWAMLCFLTGLMFVIFSSTHTPTLVVGGISAFIIALCVAWQLLPYVKKTKDGLRRAVVTSFRIHGERRGVGVRMINQSSV